MTRQIDLNGTIAGAPAGDVRALMRAIHGRLAFGRAFAADLWKCSSPQADDVLQELAALGYLEPCPAGYRGPPDEEWQITDLGVSLAHATAAPRMKRATAVRLLAAVVERARFLGEADHAYAFRVAELLVFGSYLGDSPTLGDLDVAARWSPRFGDAEAQRVYNAQRAAEAQRAGRQFSNIVEEMFFAEDEAKRYLRARNGRISLHNLNHPHDGPFVLGVPHRLVYRAPWYTPPAEGPHATAPDLGEAAPECDDRTRARAAIATLSGIFKMPPLPTD